MKELLEQYEKNYKGLDLEYDLLGKEITFVQYGREYTGIVKENMGIRVMTGLKGRKKGLKYYYLVKANDRWFAVDRSDITNAPADVCKNI